MERIRRALGPRGGGGRLGRAVAAVGAAGLLLLSAPISVHAAPTPSITITDVTVGEGSSGTTTARFTVKASPRPNGCCPLTVSWATGNGTATAPADFGASSGVVTLTRTTSSRTISVPVVADTTDEPVETFVVNLSNLVGSPGAIGDPQGVGTITDDDAAPSISIGDVAVAEGDAGTTSADLALTLSSPSAFVVGVDWATAPGTATADVDFVSASGTETIAVGATGGTISVDVLGDTMDETAESLAVSMSAPTNATIADPTGAVTITDDDPLPVLSIADASLAEGDAGTSTVTFVVTLSPASGRTVAVDWATSDGTATQPGDYQAASGSLTFVPGDPSELVNVTVNGDVGPELDEAFTVQLSNPIRSTIGDGLATGTILDDELASVIALDDPGIVEGDSGTSTLIFTATLSNPSPVAVTVDWATSPGSAAGGSDYVDGSGTVTFSAFDVSESFGITVYGDGTYETDEFLEIQLSSATNATIGDALGEGTIVNDDPLPEVSVGNVTLVEGDAGTTTFGFTVSLDRGSELDAAVDYATHEVSAIAGSDYVDADGTLVIPAGELSGTIEVSVTGDVLHEADERFDLVLSAPSSATIDDGSARGTIVDDDPAPTLSIGDATVKEGSGVTKTMVFVVTLSEVSGLTASVDWSTVDGTAQAPADYTPGSGTLNFPPGVRSRSIAVKVKGDRTDERHETVTVNLSAPVGATIADGSAVGRITDDDKTPTTVTVQVLKGRMAIRAKGLLEPARTGFRVTVSLFRRTASGYGKLVSTSVPARYIRDRDHDGRKEGIYIARFTRPGPAGHYRIVTRFAGSSTHLPCKRAVDFTLTAS